MTESVLAAVKSTGGAMGRDVIISNTCVLIGYSSQPLTTMAVSRRTFLKSSAAIVPAIVSASALGSSNSTRPSDRITVAMIGCGKMANDYHIPQLLTQSDVQLVAVCEVDQKRRERAKSRVEAKYSSAKTEYKGCDTYVDFRNIIERTDIVECDARDDDLRTNG